MSLNVKYYENHIGTIVKVAKGRPNAEIYADSKVWTEVEAPPEEPPSGEKTGSSTDEGASSGGDAVLEELIAQANELGIAANKSWKADTIRERITQALEA